MADADANLFRALTLMVAVSEQVMLELERAEPALDLELAEAVIAARDRAHRALRSERFGRLGLPDSTGTPWRRP
jgi:hypothetical protein